MQEIEIAIDLKVGGIQLTLGSNDGDVLHHITSSEFAQRVMELADYYGQPDEDLPVPGGFLPSESIPVIPRPPRLDLGTPDFVVDNDEWDDEDGEGDNPTISPEGVSTYVTADGGTVTQKPLFKPEETDPILARALESEGWS